MRWPPPPLTSPVEERIAWAESCHENLGQALLSDPRSKPLLTRFRESASASHAAMQSTGIVEICRACDQEEGGSCCGAGLEAHYDTLLLLVNRLLGVNLPQSRPDSQSCFFLGPRGCLLTTRHVLCVNYVCGKITSRIPPTGLAALREKEGEELETLLWLNERLRQVLKG